jgi:hypothetical protein
MIAALIGFDVAGGLAVVAVLSYRAFAFWLPTLPGAIAYLQLRRTVDEWEGTPRLSERRSQDHEAEDAVERDSRSSR